MEVINLIDGIKLFEGSGSPNGTLVASTGNLYLDVGSGLLYVKVGDGDTGWTLQGGGSPTDVIIANKIDTSLRRLLYASGNTAYDWGVGILYYSTGVNAIDINSRLIHDAAGTAVLDWNNLLLSDGSGVISINWDLRRLVGVDGVTNIFDWSSLVKATLNKGLEVTDGGDVYFGLSQWLVARLGPVGPIMFGVGSNGTNTSMSVVDASGTVIGNISTEVATGRVFIGSSTASEVNLVYGGATVARLASGSFQLIGATVDMVNHDILNATNIFIGTAGKGLSIKGGANPKIGTAVLVAGTVTVANTSVTAGSRIFVMSQVDGGVVGFLRVNNIVAATSFDIVSSNVLDTSTVAYVIIEET